MWIKTKSCFSVKIVKEYKQRKIEMHFSVKIVENSRNQRI